MSSRRTAHRVVVLVVGVVVAACGASGATPNPTILGSDFSARALAVCGDMVAMKQSQGAFPFPDFNPTKPDPAVLAQLPPILEKTATRYASWSVAMKALGQPAGGQAAWTSLIAAIDRHGDLNHDQIDAAAKGDAARFADDYARGVETTAALLKAATDAGIPDCAKVDH
jgi:hypothetical protein